MFKIVQSQKTIAANFTVIESQYQHNSFVIGVEFSDSTFGGYSVMASVKNPSVSDFAYTLPIIGNKITLPYYVTDKIGLLTISLFGVKGDEILTTNICEFYVAKSNPSNIYEIAPKPNWISTLQQYVEKLGSEITPSIDKATNNWLVGGVDTGVSANGVAGQDVSNKFEEINKKLRSEEITITINPNQWDSDNSYSYYDSRITLTSNQEIFPPVFTSTNSTMIKSIQSANLQDGGQWNGGLKIKCFGKKPSEVIELRIIFRGDI